MIVCLMQCRVESLLQRLILTCCSPTHTFSRPTSSSSFTSRSMQLKIHNFHFAILLFELRSSALVCCTKMAKYRFSNTAMENILHFSEFLSLFVGLLPCQATKVELNYEDFNHVFQPIQISHEICSLKISSSPPRRNWLCFDISENAFSDRAALLSKSFSVSV